jgi:hypothetical protein
LQDQMELQTSVEVEAVVLTALAIQAVAVL